MYAGIGSVIGSKQKHRATGKANDGKKNPPKSDWSGYEVDGWNKMNYTFYLATILNFQHEPKAFNSL